MLYIKDIIPNILTAVHDRNPTAIECLRLGSGGTSNFSSTESPISPVVRMMMLMRMEMIAAAIYMLQLTWNVS